MIIFFFSFGGFLGAACFVQLSRYGEHIFSEWYKDKDISCPQMEEMMIYHM